MSKTLYLHVGMPKCASTTIQGVLRMRADAFAAQGKFYGVPPLDRTEGQGNVTSLLSDMRASRKTKVMQTLAFFFERDSDVVLSSEMFIGLARNRLADDLVARATEDGFETRIICYLRRQDQWIESDYKQHIKGGSDWIDSIEDLIVHRTRTRVLNYHWLLENWARSVPRDHITVVPLTQGQGEHYPLERFLAFLDMDPGLAGELAVARQNVSPPTGLIEPMRHIKRALLARGMKPVQAARHLRVFLDRASEITTVPQRRFLMPQKRREALLKRFGDSNAALGRDYLGGRQAFDDAVAPEPEALAPLSAEAAGVLADWIVSDPAQLALAEADGDSAGEAQRGAARAPWWPVRRS